MTGTQVFVNWQKWGIGPNSYLEFNDSRIGSRLGTHLGM